jgi:hypothetical protein
LSRISVESNDLEVALTVRDSGVVQRHGRREGGLFCKIIRDTGGSADDVEMTLISDGALRVLHRGGTILVHDSERSELLGFVSADVKMQELGSSLLPALFSYKTEKSVNPAVLQTSDKRHIGR